MCVLFCVGVCEVSRSKGSTSGTSLQKGENQRLTWIGHTVHCPIQQIPNTALSH